MSINRRDAYQILTEYTKSASLLKHAECVELAMISYAKKFQEDETTWGITGLLHDFEYESFPDEHPTKGAEILRARGVSEEIVLAILGHSNDTGVPRDTKMAKTLFAVDELCGFLLACAYVRPDKSIQNVQIKSVKKKLKDKSFAAGVNRNDIYTGTEDLCVDLDEHIEFTRNAIAALD